jgi:hypothetical protein
VMCEWAHTQLNDKEGIQENKPTPSPLTKQDAQRVIPVATSNGKTLYDDCVGKIMMCVDEMQTNNETNPRIPCSAPFFLCTNHLC